MFVLGGMIVGVSVLTEELRSVGSAVESVTKDVLDWVGAAVRTPKKLLKSRGNVAEETGPETGKESETGSVGCGVGVTATSDGVGVSVGVFTTGVDVL